MRRHQRWDDLFTVETGSWFVVDTKERDPGSESGMTEVRLLRLRQLADPRNDRAGLGLER